MKVNLVRFTKDGSIKSFALPDAVTVLGRSGDCDLRIPVPSVSRRHCQINFDSNILKVRDLDSQNGIFVNGKQVKQAQLNAGDALKIGPVTFVIQIDGKPENPSLPLTEAEQFKKTNHGKTRKPAVEQAGPSKNADKEGPKKDLLDFDDLEQLDGDSSTQMDDFERPDWNSENH